MLRHLPVFCLGIIAALFLPEGYADLGVFVMLAILSLVLSYYFRPLRYALFLLLGVVYSLLRVNIMLQSSVDDREHTWQKVPLTIEVVDIQASEQKYHRFLARVFDSDTDFKRLVVNDYGEKKWPLGSRWRIQANIKSSISRVNAVGFDSEGWALSQGIDGYATVKGDRKEVKTPSILAFKYIFRHLRTRILSRIEVYQEKYPNGVALLASLAIGERRHLSTENWKSFERLGLSHLISISGLHVGMVVFLTSLLALLSLKLCLRFGMARYLPKTPLIGIVIIGFFGGIFYALLTGFSIPAQRSIIMLGVVVYAMVSRRFFSSWQIWWLALTVVLLFDPTSVLSKSFWLSFLLVASLLLVIYIRYDRCYKTNLFNFLRAQTSVTIASIVPVSLFFGGFPVYSFIANLIAIPWFTLLITPLSLLSTLFSFDFLLQFTLLLCEYTMQLMHYLVSEGFSLLILIPKVPLALVILSLLASIILIIPRGHGLKFWGVIVLFAFFIFRLPKIPEKEARVTVLDVGQGLSILIQTKQHALLFDTGKGQVANDLVANLRAKGISNLDALVLSHNDDDHDGAWQALFREISVPLILAGQPEAYVKDKAKVEFCEAGKVWDWDGVHFELLTPHFSNEKVSKNDHSCVLRVVTENHALLITGDLSVRGEHALVTRYQEDLYSDVLVLGHHGSKTSSSDFFLDTVSPKFALVSSGYRNSFHHPHDSVLTALKQRGIELFRTDKQGALLLILSDKISISQVVQRKAYWQKKPLYFKNTLE